MSVGDLNSDELQVLVGRTFVDRYRLEKFIDRGGFGAVYRAMDIRFDKVVAIKVGTSLRELKKEAILAGQVQHDNVIQVTDYGNEGGLAFMVMEFLDGQDLESLLKTCDRKLPRHLIRKFVLEVGDALIHAHSESLIHRDLKPRNVILKLPTSRGASTRAVGKFVLLDFGIAAKLDTTGTMANRTMMGAGTVEYMAPELLGRVPDATTQTDIYAFGVMLYQMLTGAVPFPQEDHSQLALAECVRAIISAPPPPFAADGSDRTYPPGVEKLVTQCLEKDPAKRPSSMEEVCRRFLEVFPDEAATGKVSHVPEVIPQTPTPSFFGRQRGRQISVGVAVLVVVFALFREYPGGSSPPTSPPIAILRVNRGAEDWGSDPLVIDARSGTRIRWQISGLPAGVVAKFDELPAVPIGMRIEHPAETDNQTLEFTLHILNPDSPEVDHKFVLKATCQAARLKFDKTFEKTLTVRIRKPLPWLPNSLEEAGFRVPLLTPLHKVEIENEVFATALERTTGTETVRFQLVAVEPKLGEQFEAVGRLPPFYVMERPVSNAQFAAFTLESPKFEDIKLDTDERPWKVPDSKPVTNISAVEAQRFAEWLAPDYGSLPSRTEWDLASGYYDFVAVVRETLGVRDFEVDPLKIKNLLRKNVRVMKAEVWLGKSPKDSEYNGKSGCSPYGCKYEAGLFEFTSFVTASNLRKEDGGGDLRDLLTKANELAKLIDAEISCRGPGTPNGDFSFVKSANGGGLKKILDFDEDGATLPLPTGMLDNDSRDSPRGIKHGFRVVLRTRSR